MMNTLILALGLVASATAAGRASGGTSGPVQTVGSSGGTITVNGATSGFSFPSSNPWQCGGKNQPKCTADNVCGKLNIAFTGLVYNDPQVIAAGFNPAQVQAAMEQDRANIVKAGYNIKAILVGSRNPNALGDVAYELFGTNWAATGVGYGVRGTRDPQLTFFFTDLIKLYRLEVPFAPILFNFSPNSTVVAIQREFPLPSGVSCANHPGKDLVSDSHELDIHWRLLTVSRARRCTPTPPRVQDALGIRYAK
ncbi:MAG: hypothetical protein INR71_12920 [Terriglobus roseus]|nr:hypothetical protein [Terriglobus roseus]